MFVTQKTIQCRFNPYSSSLIELVPRYQGIANLFWIIKSIVTPGFNQTQNKLQFTRNFHCQGLTNE